jgi:hypothetical protein
MAVAVALPLADLEELEHDGTAAKLRAIAATLTPPEHDRLVAEAAGDRLAELVQAAVLPRADGAPTVVR